MEQNVKILIIEDEEIVKETLAENLKDKGFEVDSAENAQQALSMIKESFYNILLVDYRLPDMNGLELIKEASSISRGSVAIVVTGYSAVETAVDSMRMGAYDYLLKPVDIDSLENEIKIIMQETALLNDGKRKVESVVSGLTVSNDDIIVLASRDDLIPAGKESIAKKIFLTPVMFFKKIIEFYWG
ncbi:MAG: response regulator [Endomicrobium sp.]|jgi:DNA-binding NtrC family response regulator|nr:response regulator [Endomicrobium sp.]